MKLILPLLFIGIIMVLLTSCVRHESPCGKNDRYINISPRIKSLVVKTGSYWIYKEVNTGKIDTLKLISIYNGTTYLTPCICPRFCTVAIRPYYYSVDYQSSLLGEFRLYYYINYVVSKVNTDFGMIHGTEEYIDSDTTKNSFNEYGFIEQYPQLSIQGTYFFKVDKVKIANSVFGGANTTLYWVEKVGIVKIEKENGETWELVGGMY